MLRLSVLLFCVLFLPATVSFAEEPNERIDLAVLSRPGLFAARIVFVESDSLCPEDRGNLRISGGMLTQIRMLLPGAPLFNSNGPIQAIDDETLQYRIQSPICRIILAVRQQVRRDGSWTSLLVPRGQRPSLSLEERRDDERRLVENSPKANEQIQALNLKEDAERVRAELQARRAAGSLGMVGSFSAGFGFDGKPQTCFEAAGDYQIERTGIIFSFLTGLPGDLNRFVIERADLDATRSRLYFAHGDCRFELTMSKSVLRDGQWVALPLEQRQMPKVLDHGPGRIACDLQWSRSAEKSVNGYEDFLRNCMKQ